LNFCLCFARGVHKNTWKKTPGFHFPQIQRNFSFDVTWGNLKLPELLNFIEVTWAFVLKSIGNTLAPRHYRTTGLKVNREHFGTQFSSMSRCYLRLFNTIFFEFFVLILSDSINRILGLMTIQIEIRFGLMAILQMTIRKMVITPNDFSSKQQILLIK
jgi:hypothetical protein